MNEKHLHILQHSLGVNQFGQGRQYRNHFVTSPDADNYSLVMELVDAGMMHVSNVSKALLNDCQCFCVTRQGKAYVAEHSPKPPRLTAGRIWEGCVMTCAALQKTIRALKVIQVWAEVALDEPSASPSKDFRDIAKKCTDALQENEG